MTTPRTPNADDVLRRLEAACTLPPAWTLTPTLVAGTELCPPASSARPVTVGDLVAEHEKLAAVAVEVARALVAAVTVIEALLDHEAAAVTQLAVLEAEAGAIFEDDRKGAAHLHADADDGPACECEACIRERLAKGRT